MHTTGEQLVARRHTTRTENAMSKAGDMGLSASDIINFSLGDPDLTTDQRILDACYHDMQQGHTHYTETLGQLELREEVAQYIKNKRSLTYTPDEIYITTSANHGLWLTFNALLDPGDEVLIIEPYFTPYAEQVRMNGGVPVFVPTTATTGFMPTREGLEAALTDKTRAIIVNSPTNPTGVVWDEDTLAMTADLVRTHDLFVVADDIYTIYDYARPFRSISTFPGMQERTIVMGSVSKNYCMTGFRLGYILAPSAFIEVLRDINENVVFTAPTPSQRAALAALRLHDEICPSIREIYRSRLAAATREVENTPHMSMPTPAGAIYLWIDIRDTGLDDEEVFLKLFEEAHVVVVPGRAFGESGRGFIRLAATVNEETIHHAFERIRAMPLFSA